MNGKRERTWENDKPSYKKHRPHDYHSDRQQNHHYSRDYPQKNGRTDSFRPQHSNSPNQAPRTTPVDPNFVLKDLLQQVLTSNAAWASHDQQIIHHAKELHSLLYNQSSPPRISLDLPNLNLKAPETAPYVTVTTYRANQPIEDRKALPNLPPITESYLEEATFRHPSMVFNVDRAEDLKLNYERLEFLGDAYIEIISTRIIYSRFPHLTAGQQAQLRELLVKNETLAGYSNAYGFGERISHTGDEHKTKVWTKILADVFEAYVAAIVLADPESGFQTAEKWMTELWAPKLLEEWGTPVVNIDAKSQMHKMVGAKGVKLEYTEEREMQMDRSTGRQKYFMGVFLTGWGYEKEWLGSGEGQSKVQAGAAAAMDALERSKVILEECRKKKEEVILARKREEEVRSEAEKAANGGKEDAGKEKNGIGKHLTNGKENGIKADETMEKHFEPREEHAKKEDAEKKERKEKKKKRHEDAEAKEEKESRKKKKKAKSEE